MTLYDTVLRVFTLNQNDRFLADSLMNLKKSSVGQSSNNELTIQPSEITN